MPRADAFELHRRPAKHVRLEMLRIEREANKTVAHELGEATVMGHVRERVRFFKTT